MATGRAAVASWSAHVGHAALELSIIWGSLPGPDTPVSAFSVSCACAEGIMPMKSIGARKMAQM